MCGRELNNPNDPTTEDCGGDCLKCMAQCNDYECMAAMAKIEIKHKWIKGLAWFLALAAENQVCCQDQVNLLVRYSREELTWDDMINKLMIMR
jgi:hypothetical protein